MTKSFLQHTGFCSVNIVITRDIMQMTSADRHDLDSYGQKRISKRAPLTIITIPLLPMLE